MPYISRTCDLLLASLGSISLLIQSRLHALSIYFSLFASNTIFIYTLHRALVMTTQDAASTSPPTDPDQVFRRRLHFTPLSVKAGIGNEEARNDARLMGSGRDIVAFMGGGEEPVDEFVTWGGAGNIVYHELRGRPRIGRKNCDVIGEALHEARGESQILLMEEEIGASTNLHGVGGGGCFLLGSGHLRITLYFEYTTSG